MNNIFGQSEVGGRSIKAWPITVLRAMIMKAFNILVELVIVESKREKVRFRICSGNHIELELSGQKSCEGGCASFLHSKENNIRVSFKRALIVGKV